MYNEKHLKESLPRILKSLRIFLLMTPETEPRRSIEGITTSVVLGDYRVNNQELANYLTAVGARKDQKQVIANQIKSTTGIEIRYALQPLGATPKPIDQTVPELAVKAAEQALQKRGWLAQQVDIILACTSYPFGQELSRIIAKQLNANNVFFKDTYAACSGATVALDSFARLGVSNVNVLIVGAEHYSAHLAPDGPDSMNRRIFSDGAAAIAFRIGRDGDIQILAHDYIWDINPAIKMPIDEQLIPENSWWLPVPNRVEYFRMNGTAVLDWIRKGKYLDLYSRVYRDSSPKGESQTIPHPASKPVLDTFEKLLAQKGVDTRLSRITLPHIGNMAASGWIAELDALLATSRSIQKGTTAFLAGYGAGLGGAVVGIQFLKTPQSK